MLSSLWIQDSEADEGIHIPCKRRGAGGKKEEIAASLPVGIPLTARWERKSARSWIFDLLLTRVMNIGGGEGDQARYHHIGVPSSSLCSEFSVLCKAKNSTLHLCKPWSCISNHSTLKTISYCRPDPEGRTQTRDIAASMAALARSVHMR